VREGRGREGEWKGREDALSPGGGGVMNVGVGVPWGGRAADTSAVKEMVAQRMRVLSCMATVRLEAEERELGRRELEMGLNVCRAKEQQEAFYLSILHPPSSLTHFRFWRSIRENGTSH
jgi:hypothetical protein